MERIEQFYKNNYSPVVIYLNDLKLVYDTLYAIDPNLTIKSRNFKYNNWEDFITNYKGDSNLTFRLSKIVNGKYDVELEFGQYRVHLDTSGTEPSTIAHTYVQLDGILNSCKTFKGAKTWRIMQFFLIIISMIAFVVLDHQHLNGTKYFALLIAIIALITTSSTTESVKIHLHNKGEKKNIFQRNKDEIFSNVVAAVVGAIIGYLLGKL